MLEIIYDSCQRQSRQYYVQDIRSVHCDPVLYGIGSRDIVPRRKTDPYFCKPESGHFLERCFDPAPVAAATTAQIAATTAMTHTRGLPKASISI